MAMPLIYVIQLPFPTSNNSDEKIDVMYGEPEELSNFTVDKSNAFILGDFNASYGEKTTTSIHLGKYGFGKKMIEVPISIYISEVLDIISLGNIVINNSTFYNDIYYSDSSRYHFVIKNE